MRIEVEEKIQPIMRTEALAALWRIKLWLGRFPVHIRQDNAAVPPKHLRLLEK